MILDMETETDVSATVSADRRFEAEFAEPIPSRRRVNLFLIGPILFVLLGSGVGWYLYARGYEDTDDAQVDGHLNPIAARISRPSMLRRISTFKAERYWWNLIQATSRSH